ncbi:hypothetical protein [Novipirellula aureliae]|nr:hypothetical protein [Novipirellula aureliae]
MNRDSPINPYRPSNPPQPSTMTADRLLFDLLFDGTIDAED